ncbi:ATP-binding protein [uncultured Sutterella sp.]|uniref:ATP-binding protein n=1 Tax=uncultured Sutterella sp. TaxID=286133 RepID=UPI00266C7F17|nr:ATP-binding protein [uncultured Sutterella sp.]
MPGIRAFLWVFLSLTVVAAALTTELPAPAAAAPGAEPAATLRLGIIDDPDNPQQTEVLKESAEALRKALPGLRIELSALGELELQKAVLDRKIDMYMLSAGFHAYVADLGGADLIAALKPPYASAPSAAAGAVFLVRADDREHSSLFSLRSARVAAESPESFNGWAAALLEVANVTPYPEVFFGKTIFTGESALAAIELLRSARVETAILEACRYEMLLASGQIRPDEFRVVSEKPQTDGFRCVRSTQLYPGIVAGARTAVDGQIKERAAEVLYGLKFPSAPGFEAYGSASGWKWTLSTDLRSVRRVLQRFSFVPTAASRLGVTQTVTRYKFALLIGFLVLAGAFTYSYVVSRTVQERTKSLNDALGEKIRLERKEKSARERLSQLERAGMVSELSSMISHELRQPVASLINYADGLRVYLGDRAKADPILTEATDEIIRQATRVSDIVTRVRNYAKKRAGEHVRCNLSEITNLAIDTFIVGSECEHAIHSITLPDDAPLCCDPLEIELLIVNFLRNALQAVERNAPDEEKRIDVRILRDSGFWRLEVEDNGPEIPDETLRDLSHPVSSDKLEGLGLGLSLCRVIAERHTARLGFRRALPHGLIASLSIPAAEEKSDADN